MLRPRKNFNPDAVHCHDEEGPALVSSLQGLGHAKNHRGYRRFPRTIRSRWVALCCGLLVLAATYRVGWKIGLGGSGGNATDAEGTDPVGNEWPDWPRPVAAAEDGFENGTFTVTTSTVAADVTKATTMVTKEKDEGKGEEEETEENEIKKLNPKYPIATSGVHLVHDKAWFQNKTKAGCCPFAVKLYKRKYGHMHNRCCTDRLDKIEPWRPVGGANWEMIMKMASLQNKTLTIQGDSLAEQHFIAMLCHAWSSDGVEVTGLSKLNGVRVKHGGAVWEARFEPIGITITFLRWNIPQLKPNFDYSKPTFLIVGGWHHGGSSEKEINFFLDQLEELRGEYDTIVVQALPNHFPGGSYFRHPNKYPKTKVGLWNSSNSASVSNVSNSMLVVQSSPTGRDQVCDTFAMRSGDPDINDPMEQWMKNRPQTMNTLRVQHLYRYRGDAHLGKIPTGTVGTKGRDCLHWCIAPGVLDALAIETLSVIHRLHYSRGKALSYRASWTSVRRTFRHEPFS